MGYFDFPDENRYRSAILNSDFNPFPEPPASSNIENRPAKFMVGRQEFLLKLDNLYESIISSGDSKLVMIQGSQGVGKSTLVSNFIIRQQKSKKSVYIIPFETSGSPGNLNFSTFFGLMAYSFLKQESLYDITYKIVSNILQLYFEHSDYHQIFDRLGLSNEEYLQIQHAPQKLREFDKKNRDVKFITRFTQIFEEYFNEIASFLPSRDASLFLVLFYAIFSNRQVFKAQRSLTGTDEFQGFDIRNELRAKSYFKELIDILKWIQQDTVLILAIDHLEAGTSNPKEVYNELFSLLLEFRQIKHVFIILSGTFDAFQSIQDNIQEDKYHQIENWCFKNTFGLKPLKPSEIHQIVQYHLNKLWNKYNLTTPSHNPLYPYAIDAVTYIYSYYQKDLRRMLENLYNHYQNMVKEREVEHIATLFDAVRRFRDQNIFVLNRDEIPIFKNRLLDKTIQDKERSTMLENAIVDLMKIIASENPNITSVKHEPPLGKKKLKPDVYFEIGKSLAETRKIACEVKLYRKIKEIPDKEVKKTHSLLIDNLVDYIIWVSNRPLNNSKYNLPNILYNRVGRSAELSDKELAYCSLLVFRDQLWSNEEIDADRAKRLLLNAGIDLNEHISIVNGQSKNSGYTLQEQVRNSLDVHFNPQTNQKEQTAEIAQTEEKKEQESIDHEELTEDATDGQLSPVYVNMIIKFIESKSTQKTMGISTVFTHMKKKKYDLEDIMDKDEAVISIREIAESNGYKTNTTKILFNN